MLATWLWLREHEPEVTEATAHLLLPKDYLRYRLTGKLGSEPSDASSTLLFDTARRCWSTLLLDALRIDPDLLPPIHESAEIAGNGRRPPTSWRPSFVVARGATSVPQVRGRSRRRRTRHLAVANERETSS